MSHAPAPTFLATVVAPAVAAFPGGQPIDLVGLADVKLELEIEGNADDVWLRKRITAASRAASKYCNRVFQQQTYRELIWARRDPYPWQVPSGFAPLQLLHWPLVAPASPALVAPPPAPSLSCVAGGTAAAALLCVRATYVSPYGETAASLESEILVPADNLLAVAPPGPDRNGIATGWNVYVGAAAAEVLQNPAPLGLDSGWTAPASPAATGASPPAYILAVENVATPAAGAAAPLGGAPIALCEGVDFRADRQLAQLVRIGRDGYVRPWPALPLLVQYRAGYAAIPDDVQDAVLLLVKMRWYGRKRDPLLRSENAGGAYEAAYVMGTGPGGPDDMPAEPAGKLWRYRVPVIA